MQNEKKFSIILPVLNEAENLKILVPKINTLFLSENYFIEMIIVDDNSTDNISEVIHNLKDLNSSKFIVSYHRRESKNSLPLSILYGIENSKYPIVMWLDADNSMSGEAVFSLTKEYFESTFDTLIGSRYVNGGGYKGIKVVGETSLFQAIQNVQKSNDTISGVLLSLVFNKLLVIFSNSEIKDMTSGFIIINKKFLDRSDFEGFTYGEYFIKVAHSIQKQNLSFKEIGYLCEPRIYGESKTGTNLIKLIIRGLGYLKISLKFRL